MLVTQLAFAEKKNERSSDTSVTMGSYTWGAGVQVVQERSDGNQFAVAFDSSSLFWLFLQLSYRTTQSSSLAACRSLCREACL